MSSDSNNMGNLDNVVAALKNVLNKEKSADSDDSSSSQDSVAKCEDSFFCVEECFLAKDVEVTVNEVGPLSFPIDEDVIKRLIGRSEKAKYGKGVKTVLDTSYRDTQMIPADKLKVEIDKQALDTLLQRIGQELKIGEYSMLEIHLYNMLIYGPGQFFKRHRDTEKIPNMIATLVMVLPSPHKGGDLIIQHHSLKHKFFGSLNPDIIRCVTFYSDCYHEVKKVNEGYRVALTFNVVLKSGSIPGLMAVDKNLKDAVNSYFEKTKSDKLVYLLDHQYTKHSLRWYMLKGADQICAKALLAVGKANGYPPCLALVTYRESWVEDYEEEGENKFTSLHFWIDENNIPFDFKETEVSEKKICFMKDTKLQFSPYNREEEATGNEGTTIDVVYHRSAVVLWRDTWAFCDTYKIEYHALHQLTARPGMQRTLLKKVAECSKMFFASPFWKDESAKKMALDIMIYLNDEETTFKILSKLNPLEVLDLAKSKVVSWIANNCSLKTWKTLVEAWGSKHGSEDLVKCFLPYLLNYMTKEDKDLEIAGYLLDETAKFFMNPNKKFNKLSFLYDRSYGNQDKKSKQLCSLLKLSFELNKPDLEKNLMKNFNSKSSVAHFKMFEEALHREQFTRISGEMLFNMAIVALEKIKKEEYIYPAPSQNCIDEICSVLKSCGKTGNAAAEQKILNHILSDSDTYTASFLADLLISMHQLLGDYVGNYTDFKKSALTRIQAELEKLKNPNDCSLPINISCNCQYCSQVKSFFASSTSMHISIGAAERYRSHMESFLTDFRYLWPIKYETVASGSPHKLVITKLPKLLEDRRKFIGRLIQGRNTVVQTNQSPGNLPAAKKCKTQ